MTFEKAYKAILKTQLENATNRNVYISNDLHYKPLDNDPDGIVMVINTGGGTKSSINGYDMNTVPMSINFICQANYLQEIFGILASISKEHNAKYYQTTIDGVNYNYKIVYSDAMQLGGVYKEHLKAGTYNLITGNWLLTATYSHNAIIEPSVFKLTIGSTEYDINYIVRYEMSSQDVTEPVQYLGETYQEHLPITRTLVYSFVLLKVQSDAFQTLLRELMDGTDDLNATVKTLKIDNQEIPITKLTATEIFENNASVVNLVLTR